MYQPGGVGRLQVPASVNRRLDYLHRDVLYSSSTAGDLHIDNASDPAEWTGLVHIYANVQNTQLVTVDINVSVTTCLSCVCDCKMSKKVY